ncbi:amidinotransferase [Stylonychia lemnae]|uniref:Amidinotransferase n=1 Tax=Stylonychia lemnae TaxID=5949 RepID=A0A078ASS3_STYLE|nr:amidinotransferase [Stylonychia lemnae]|eukprot:CDW85066.1 amidinotransferase [Stylonychia lemnae]
MNQQSFAQVYSQKVLMVEPTHFFLNEETFQDNKFMNKVQIDQRESSLKAIEEFGKFKDLLLENDIDVQVYKQLTPDLPDSVFPNNWFSTHKGTDIPDGLFVVYPMKAETREREKNPLIIQQEGVNYKNYIDLRKFEYSTALEGTGSLIFDTTNKKIYVNLSERADASLLTEFVEKFNKISQNPYKSVVFNAVDAKNNPIYHTNVIMALLKDHALLCTESIKDEEERQRVIREITDESLNICPKKLIDLNYEEINNMCGNMIMVQNKRGEHCVIMSQRARDSLRKEYLKELEENYRIVASDINMIETIGGGSARCMVAELY